MRCSDDFTVFALHPRKSLILLRCGFSFSPYLAWNFSHALPSLWKISKIASACGVSCPLMKSIASFSSMECGSSTLPLELKRIESELAESGSLEIVVILTTSDFLTTAFTMGRLGSTVIVRYLSSMLVMTPCAS